VIDSDNWTVDDDGTRSLRSEIRQSRIGKAGAVLREDWPRKEKKGADL
jgi:hypothetical protein